MRAASILLLAIACNDGESDDTGTEPDPLPVELDDCADGTTLTYDDAEPVFAACTGCHSSDLSGDDRNGAPALINFDTAEDAAANAFLTWSMIVSGQMPKGGDPLPEDEALLVWEWLSCGGPE